MASIISTDIMFDRAQANGRRLVRYKVVIEDNYIVQQEFTLPPKTVLSGFDSEVAKTTVSANLLDNLQSSEVQEVFNLAQTREEHIDNLAALQAQILNRVNNPRYAIKKRIRKKLIYYLMRRADAQYTLNVKDVYDDLPATDTGKKNQLDITQGQLNKLKAKVAEFYDAPVVSKSGVDIINGAFTTEADDWGDIE